MEFDYVAFILCLLYSVLFLFGFKQFLQIFYLKNRKINYRNGIIVTLLFSSLLRTIFWVKVMVATTVSNTLMMIIFYLPVWLNFCGISLLCVFYANTIYEDKYGSWPKYICIVFNVIFFVLDITIGCLVDSPMTNQRQNRDIYLCYIYYAVGIDLLCALLIGYFGYYFVYDNNFHSYRHWILLPRSIETFAFFNWLIVVCFIVRSVFVFVSSLPNMKDRLHTELHFNGDHSVTSLIMFFFFLVTEWIPNSAMLYLLWKPNTKRKNKKFSSSQYMNTHGGGSGEGLDESPSTSQKGFKLTSLLHDLSQHSAHSLSALLFPQSSAAQTNEDQEQGDSPSTSSANLLSNYNFGPSRRYKPLRSTLDGDDHPHSSGSYSEHLLTEDDLRDQGFHIRNQSIEGDQVVKVIYNRPSESSSIGGGGPRASVDTNRSSDYGQHVIITPDDHHDYYTGGGMMLPPPHLNHRPPSLLNPSQVTTTSRTTGQSKLTPVSGGPNNHKSPEENLFQQQHQNYPSQYRSQPLTSSSSGKNTVISSLYLNQTPSIIAGKTQVLYDPSKTISPEETTPNTNSGNSSGNNNRNRTGSSFSSTQSHSRAGSVVHLDPSAIFKIVDTPKDEDKQLPQQSHHHQHQHHHRDNNEKYANTIGPRDILKTKM
jgi:hypothetical protein